MKEMSEQPLIVPRGDEVQMTLEDGIVLADDTQAAQESPPDLGVQVSDATRVADRMG